MPRPIRNSRGFTGIEILVVLAVVAVLAGVGYAGTIQYRAYAAEAEMRQDLVHFVNQQQVLRQRTGSLGTMEQLVDIGFQRSPGVVVEENRLHGGGRRAYLRVRHRKTGQRCSVDYSPFVSNALNRVQCWAGPNDRDSTETVAGSDGNPTPGGTTVVVDTPVAPPVPGQCVGVPVLGIASPADQTDANPGAAGSGTFTLSNPGAAARSYNLRFSSSNPAVVPSVAGPASVAVPAGASRSVAATFQVASGAESGQVAVLPLEATDVECPSLTADGFFAVSARLMLMDPAMTTPPDLTVIPGQTADVAWSTTNRVNATRMLRLGATYPGTLTRESATGLGSIPFARGETQGTQLRLRLSASVDGFTPHRVCLTATDQEAPSYDAEQCMTITAAFQSRPATITVTGGDARTELPNAVFTQTWTVTNNSNAARDFRITPEQTGDLTLRSTSIGPTVRIGRDQSVTVTATYQVSGTSLYRTPSTTTLTVVDPGAAAQSTSTHTSSVTTSLALAHPTVTSAPELRADPGESGRLIYSLRNNTNEDRTFSFAYASSRPEAAAATATPARVTVPAFGSVPVEGPFSVPGSAEGEWAANFTLTGTDILATSYSGSGGGKVTVNTVLAPPTIVDPPSCPSGDPGASGTLAYSLRNNSNVARTFGFTFTSSATHAATPAGTPTNVTVPAFSTVAVNGPWAIPATAQGGWTSTLTLAGRDAAATSLAGSGRCIVTVNTVLLPPAVSAGPGVTGSYGQWATIPFVVTNQSNVTRSFVLTPSAGNPPIVAAFGQIGAITLPAFGSTSVNLPLQFSANPSANLASAITLTATDAAIGSHTSAATSGATRINTAPAVSPTFTPNNVPRGTTITGTSNATDPDGVIAAVHWWTNSPSGARVYRGNSASIAFVPNEVGNWTLSTQAIDNNDAPSPTVTTSAITVVNRAPTAVLRVTYPRAEPFIYNDEVTQLDLHQSSDPDGDPLTGNLSSGMSGTWTPPAQSGYFNVSASVSDGMPEGTASSTVSIRVVKREYGCMDPGALNYNPAANSPAHCIYVQPPVANVRVYQDGDNRGSYWTRKWTYADPSASHPGDGATGISQYQWTWGMAWAQWDQSQGRFVTSADALPTYVTTSGATQRVAYDNAGDFPICVTVWNNAGLSDDDCKTVAMKRETRARLSWMYRSSWIDHANWAPGNWFGNGHGDHGQQRHTFNANASTGDVPIQHAWMELRMRVWRDTRSNLRDVYFSHTQASEDVRPTQSLIDERCGSRDIMRYEDGIWCYERAWRMEVYPRSDGTMPLMYQPFHLGRDGWLGENVDQGTAYSEFTLHVIDINGRETTDTKRRWHQDWREGTIGWVNSTQSGPTASFQNQVTSDDGAMMTLSGLRGQSDEGRVVRMWYVVEYDPGNGDQNQYSSYPVYGSDSYELHRPECGRASVTVMAEDDQGRQGWGATYELRNPERPTCLLEGGGIQVPL